MMKNMRVFNSLFILKHICKYKYIYFKRKFNKVVVFKIVHVIQFIRKFICLKSYI